MEGINLDEDENLTTTNELAVVEDTENLHNRDSDTEEAGEVQDNEDESQENWSGSGIWERSEKRRWIAVSNHRIPSRSRTVSESNLVLVDMGTGQFVQNFDSQPSQNSESDQEFRIVTSTQSIIRLNVPDTVDEAVPSTSRASTSAPSSSFSGSSNSSRLVIDTVTTPSEDLGEPVAGPSGRSHSHNLAGHQADIRGHSSNLARSVQEGRDNAEAASSHSNSSRINSYLQRKMRKNGKRRKRKKNQRNQRKKFDSYSAPRQKISLSRSVDSSPGRDSPSPATLAKICLYWEQRLASPEYVILSDPESEP